MCLFAFVDGAPRVGVNVSVGRHFFTTRFSSVSDVKQYMLAHTASAPAQNAEKRKGGVSFLFESKKFWKFSPKETEFLNGNKQPVRGREGGVDAPSRGFLAFN